LFSPIPEDHVDRLSEFKLNLSRLLANGAYAPHPAPPGYRLYVHVGGNRRYLSDDGAVLVECWSNRDDLPNPHCRAFIKRDGRSVYAAFAAAAEPEFPRLVEEAEAFAERASQYCYLR